MPGLTKKKVGPLFRTDVYSSSVRETYSKHESSAHSHMNSANIGLSVDAVDSIRSFTSRKSDSIARRALLPCFCCHRPSILVL